MGDLALLISGRCAFCHSLSPVSVTLYNKSLFVSHLCRLHIEQGFLEPLVSLRLHRVLHGIKRLLGDSGSTRHLVTNSTLLIIFNLLHMNIPVHCTFLATCNCLLCFSQFMKVYSSEFGQPLKGCSFDIHPRIVYLSSHFPSGLKNGPLP